MIAIADNEQPKYVEDIVDPTRTSKYLQTLRSVAWMLHWRKSIKNTQTNLTSEELQCAKLVILKQVQQKFFWKELKSLESGQPVPHQSNLMSSHPFLEDGFRSCAQKSWSHLLYGSVGNAPGSWLLLHLNRHLHSLVVV